MILKKLDYMSYVIKGSPLPHPVHKKFNSNRHDYKTDKEKATHVGTELYKNWINKLTKTEKKEFKKILQEYTGSHYDSINSYLRETNGKIYHDDINDILEKLDLNPKKLKQINDRILKLDKSFKKAKTSTKLVTYRRVSSLQFFDENVILRGKDNKIDRALFVKLQHEFYGQTFQQHSFLSTSLSQDPNKSFNDQRFPILLKINIPKGTRAIYVDEISNYPGQNELLLNRGYTFRYDDFKIIRKKGFESIKVEVSLVRKNLLHVFLNKN